MNGPARAADPPALTDPLQIGRVTIPNRVVVGPLAGITTSAFRRRLKLLGAGLVTTEMVSAYGLVYADRRTWSYLTFREDERPLAVQLFGDRADIVATAIQVLLSADIIPDIIDLNMGCPVRKVMKTGAGAALLADPAHAAEVAQAAVQAAGAIPVTAKIRSGMRPEESVAVDVALRLEQAGVAAVAVHPRAASQFYRGHADHSITAEVVAATRIPVMASGDVVSVAAAQRISRQTGAAAIMVARGMLGDPWLVQRLLSGRERPAPTVALAIAELRALLAAAADDMGGDRAVRWMRKSMAWYLRAAGVPGTVARSFQSIGGVDELDAALSAYLRVTVDSSLPSPLQSRPVSEAAEGGFSVLHKDVVLTPEGMAKLQEEIDYLSTAKREEVAERIKEAREFGDISENSEYDDAKNDQAMLEHRISLLQEKLRRARVIKVTEISTEKVSLGSTVTLKDLDYDEEFTYTMVGSAEADPTNHKLSNESPVGQAILGRKVGEMVTVPAPAGSLRYEVVRIEAY